MTSRRTARRALARKAGVPSVQHELVELRRQFEHWKKLAQRPLLEIAKDIEAGRGGDTRAEIVAFIRNTAAQLRERE